MNSFKTVILIVLVKPQSTKYA